MHILLVTDSYPPEIRSASHLMQELAEELKDRGHSVTVISCYPMYNLAESTVNKKYEEVSIENGIRVIRTHTLPHHKVNFIVRGLSQLTLPHVFWFKLKRHLLDKVDVVLVYSPPLPLWKIGLWVKKSHRARYILNIQDIFPQNAIDLGALRIPFLIRFFEKMEKTAYDFADVITVHSRGNGDFLIRQKKVAPEKLVTLHNWVEIGTGDISSSNNNSYRKKLDLENKFIFFFGGVLGPSQGLDLLIDAAKQLQGNREIVILLAGDGTEKERLEQRVRDEGILNVVFHPFLQKEQYQMLLKEIDVGLVSLTIKNRTPVVPGKILGYMASGNPVLAFLNKESDGHQIIREAECGYSEESDSVQKAVKLMQKMYQEKDSLRKLGLNGYHYAMKNFSKNVCVDKLEGYMY